jgi:predicted nucleic acid-binding protein
MDASVGIKLFVDEEYSDKVHGLFAGLSESQQTEIFVSDLFYIECTNILLKYTRRLGRPLKDSLADIRDLNKLALKVISTSELIEEALILADEKHLTAYDACYAVLARKLDISLVTADAPVAKAIDWAIWIGDVEF